MAETGNAPNNFRISSIYIGPEMEGYLEKKGSGMIPRKTKMYCSIQGTLMYLKKNQDQMDTLDLCDAYQVKKVSADLTCTSFEILFKKKSKSYVFISSTSDECSQWVRALHNAMAKRELRNSTLLLDAPNEVPPEYTKYESIYATIAGDAPGPEKNTNNRSSTCKVTDYAAPYDAQSKDEPVYYGIMNGSLLPETALKSSSIYEEVVSSTPTVNNRHESQVYSECYSQNDKSSNSQNGGGAVLRSSKNIPVNCVKQTDQAIKQNDSFTDQAIKQNDTNVYADGTSEISNNYVLRSSVNTAASSVAVSTSSEQRPKFETDSNDPLHLLVAALEIDESPVPQFNHPLTEEDRLPVKELTDYLANNQPLCYVRYSQAPIAEDPINSLKSLLKDLNL